MNLTSRLSNWMEKAKERARIIRELKQKLKRKQQQVDRYKEKYRLLQQQYKSLEASVTRCSHSINVPVAVKPPRHHYEASLIRFCLHLHTRGNLSVRSIPRVLECTKHYLEVPYEKIPCHSTVHTWLRKVGLHALKHVPEKEDAGEQWMLIADESVQVGKEVLLMIIGVPLSKYDGGTLCFSKARLLYVSSNSSWNAGQIKTAIKKVTSDLAGEVAYILIDGGNSLNAAIKNTHWALVRDCTHKMAEILRNIYGKSQAFTNLSKCLKLIRQQGILSDYAPFIPPRQRAKARFLNMGDICRWAEKLLAYLPKWKDEKKKMYTFFAPLLEHKPLLKELIVVNKVIDKCLSLLKKGNVNLSVMRQIYPYLANLNFERGKQFAHKFKAYLFELLSSGQNRPIVCSDIIESLFGKLKEKMGNTCMGFSSLVTSLALETGKPVSLQHIGQACSQTKWKDVNAWEKQYLKVSFTRLKRQAWNL
jgi:uncharacterized coiled-coil protein SlyX